MMVSSMSHSSFTMFGWQHGLTLLTILLLALLIPSLIKASPSQKAVKPAAVLLALAILGFKAWEIAWYAGRGIPWVHLLPLHLCDAAALVSGIMLLTGNRFLFELNYFWGLGGTTQALLTPDLSEGFPSTGYFLFFISHGLVMLGLAFGLIVLRFRPTLKSILRVFLATVAMSLLAGGVNALAGTNYMYMARKPDAATLLDYLGPWPWYVLAGYPVVLFFLFLVYSPFWVGDRIKQNRTR